jgi:hypothetical protein
LAQLSFCQTNIGILLDRQPNVAIFSLFSLLRLCVFCVPHDTWFFWFRVLMHAEQKIPPIWVDEDTLPLRIAQVLYGHIGNVRLPRSHWYRVLARSTRASIRGCFQYCHADTIGL